MSVFILFLATVVLITMSGALAPGPLFFTNLSNAHRWGWRGGLWLSLGHTVIELPLILIIMVGLNLLIDNLLLQVLTSILGGIVLFIFGGFQIRDAFKLRSYTPEMKVNKVGTTRHPLIIGILFTGLNPFFLIWWLTVGTNLVLNAFLLAALAGVLIMFFAHVWMDYAWLAGTAWLTKKGTQLVGTRGYAILTGGLGLILIYFGAAFCWNGLLMIYFP